MEIILVLIPVSLVIVGCAIAAFVWAVDSGQYDDLDRGGQESLFPDDASRPAPERTPDKPTIT